MAALDAYRRFYAEEVETACGLRTRALVDALAAVPRERFLGPGPWLVADMFGAPRATPDDDPRRVCHNVAIAIPATSPAIRRCPCSVRTLTICSQPGGLSVPKESGQSGTAKPASRLVTSAPATTRPKVATTVKRARRATRGDEPGSVPF